MWVIALNTHKKMNLLYKYMVCINHTENVKNNFIQER